jgi:hypothetical protein
MIAPGLPAPLLDTREQFDIDRRHRGERPLGDAPSDRRWIEDLGRTKRADEAKVALSRYLRQAALEYWEEGLPGDSLLLDDWALALLACRTGHPVLDRKCGRYAFVACSCDVRLCPDCERARSARLVARYDEVGSAMANPRFWTLTLPNVPPGRLHEGIGVLLDALAHLRRRSIFVGGPCGNEHRAVAYVDGDTGEIHRSSDDLNRCSHPHHQKLLAENGTCRCARCLEVVVERAGYRVTANGCPRCTHDAVVGGIYSVETTWSSAQSDWHPHAHLLMDAPWIVWSEMRDAWRAVTCDAIRRAERADKTPLPRCPHLADERGIATSGCRGASIVWVSPVEGAPGTPERKAAVRETLKYVSKGLLDNQGQLLPGAGSHELAELLLAIRRRRLVAGWGTFRNVHDDEDEPGADTVPVYTGEFDRFDRPVTFYMAKTCPFCGQEADWEASSALVPRIECRRTAAGVLTWGPPGGSA